MNRPRSIDILVITALKQEIKGLAQFFRPSACQMIPGRLDNRYWESTLNGATVGFRVCGVGRKRAVKDITTLLSHVQPRQILVVGFSGSLIPRLSIGDIAVIESTQYKESTLAFNSGLTQTIELALQKARKPHIIGKSVTVDTVIDTAEAKTNLHSSSKADCVDMESYHLVALAETHLIPIAMIRVISDCADETLGLDFSAIPREKWAARRYFLRQPNLWYPLIKLRIDITKATTSLTSATLSVLGLLLNRPAP